MSSDREGVDLQRGLQPSAADPAEGAPEPSAPNAPGRAPDGRFLPGHTFSVTHGLHTDREDSLRFCASDLTVLREEVAQFLEAALVDEGEDAADVPARRMALLGYRARLHRRILQVDAALEVRGLFDKRGKLRVAWLAQLKALVEAARAIDGQLGLARRQKPVTTLDDVRFAAAERTRGEDAA